VRKENISVGAADIHVSPDGKYLYATNRGTANDITCFGILKNGHLKFIQQTSVLGMGPRNFCITRMENLCWWAIREPIRLWFLIAIKKPENLPIPV